MVDQLVSEGLATVRKESAKQTETAYLSEMEEAAKNNKKGIWSSDDKEEHVRKVTWAVENPNEFFQANKDKTLTAIVEHVRDGSTLRLIIVPGYTYITLMLSGIRCPSFKLDSTGRPDDSVTVPYALEARFFTESRLLNQEVSVKLEGVSNNNFVGTISHPKGNIAEALVREGFAKCIDWSLNSCSIELVEKLRIAEKSAKQNKTRVWENYQTASTNVDVKEKEFTGIVVEVFNGDWVMVKCQNNELKKCFIASIRSPKDDTKADDEGKKPTKLARPLYEVPYLYECREFLRKRLIGKKATCKLDYITPSKDTMPERRSYSIFVNGKNIAEELVGAGLATVIRYRQDNDQRSSSYSELLSAEATATKDGLGMHGSKKDQSIIRLIDLTVDTSKIRHQYLPSWQRALQLDAIVEFVATGSRFRIFIPRETCLVTFLLGGIIVPRSSRPALNGMPATTGEPFGDEALAFVKARVFQRDVNIKIDSADKQFSAVIGFMFTENKTNMSVALLEEGLAKIHPPSAEKSEYYRFLKQAEDKAKSKRKNIWKDYKEEDETLVESNTDTVAETPVEKQVKEDIVVIEVTPELSFYGQKADDQAKLTKLMDSLRSALDKNSAGGRFKRGDICAAKFSVDNQWYRVKVEKIDKDKAQIQYVDYGNREVVNTSTLVDLPASLKVEKPYATEYKLALVSLPIDEDEKVDACSTFAADALDKKLTASTLFRVNGVPHVVLYNGDEDIGKGLIKDGFVLVEHRKEGTVQKLVRH